MSSRKNKIKYWFANTLLFSIFILTQTFMSCASLQEDVMISSSGEALVLEQADNYEERFWDFDSALLSGQVVSIKEMESYCSEIEKKITIHTEPVLASRLEALEGLVMLQSKKTKKAEELYEKAKALHSGDEYVLLLCSRLANTDEERLSLLNEYSLFDSSNPIFALEKSIVLYRTGDFTQAVANLDKAFLLFDQKDENNLFRSRYTAFRNSVWKLHSAGIENSGNLDISNVLGTERMAVLTMERTGLLEDLLGGTKPSGKELLKKLEKAGYFTAPGDPDESLESVKDYQNVQDGITRTLCARFLWNVYVREKGNLKLLNGYSTRFSRLKDPHSPIGDLPLSSLDFDSVLGCVEKEIMDLTDGVSFEGNKVVTELEFVEFLQRCELVLK